MNIKRIVAVAGVFLACAGFLGIGESSSNSVVMGPDGKPLYRIPGTFPVEIPEGISDKQALDAVELAVKGTGAGEKNIHWVSQWRMESRDPANKWIQIGLTARNHYLCVCYRIEAGKLVPDVPTSTNLKQNGTSIHRKVPAWINNLKPLISQRLYTMANPGGGAAAAGKETAKPADKPATGFCKFCGAKVDADANFCGGCGKKLK